MTMPFIDTISTRDADTDVRNMYARQQGAWGFVPGYAKVFCHRPEVMARWGMMLAEIKRPVSARRLELVTLAAALELKHSACSLAHGYALSKITSEDVVIAIAKGETHPELSKAEVAMVSFARRVARDASKITSGEVAALKKTHGFSDAEIFDIAAIAASRSFFTKLLDALGTEPDAAFMRMSDEMRRALTVGRPISCTPPEVLEEEDAA
jgi:uncharacterized peroxidase-related enzyme